MNKKIKIIALLCALVLVNGVAFIAFRTAYAPAEPPTVNTQEGEPYIDFAAEDAASNPVRLSDFIGKPTIVYFWTTWCGFCTRGMDELQTLQDSLGGQVQILAVNLPTMGGMTNEAELGRAYMTEMNFGFPSIYDVYGEALSAYRITGVPLILFIDSDGNIVDRILGFADANVLAEYVAVLQ